MKRIQYLVLNGSVFTLHKCHISATYYTLSVF